MAKLQAAAIQGNFVPDMLSSLITNNIANLLSDKHLYQSIKLDPSNIVREIESQTTAPAVDREMAKHYLDLYLGWAFIPKAEIVQFPVEGTNAFAFTLPTVKTYCEHCKAIQPHNPTPPSAFDLKIFHSSTALPSAIDPRQWQVFCLPYHCQGCKVSTVVFLLERHALKFTLSGRNPIDRVIIPSFIPLKFQGFVSEAIVASETGSALCGLFLLRVFIEQYCSSKCVEPCTSCDKAIDGYMETLPADFRGRFPSLRDVYAVLSEAIHKANDDLQLFEEQKEKIYNHFDAKRIYSISN